MLERFKVATIDSGLHPLFGAGKPPKAPMPGPKPMVSSLGDKMRRETSSAIEQGLKHGSVAALERFGLKAAFEAAAPAATVGSSWMPRLPTMGGAKKTLGLMGAGALAAGAYGLHKQHQHDTNNNQLVYAPMQGDL